MAILTSMRSLHCQLRTFVAAAGGSRRVLLILLLGVLSLGGHSLLAADSVPKEYQLKAAFLYNFTKFVVWAPRAVDKDAALVIGVLGVNPFGDELEKIVSSRSVGGRRIEVRFLSSAAEARAVHMLFIPAGEERRVAGEMDALHAASVLTVGETSRFADMGGIITFSMEADKIRFEINREVAAYAGLKISPQLLKLATSARKGNG